MTEPHVPRDQHPPPTENQGGVTPNILEAYKAVFVHVEALPAGDERDRALAALKSSSTWALKSLGHAHQN